MVVVKGCRGGGDGWLMVVVADVGLQYDGGGVAVAVAVAWF